ncbi:hypothetical protein GCM10010515_70230 [Streptomyces fructofermentans]|uniref:Uncharacterized protein n=1 Tax=Streptomyces fructofermentans TaxID=152141 RepID=A0A918NSW2_9ACTN|nr:hypothetical protein GCM10010515_70230 [Streptomyces fructofermentans]
MLPTLPARHRRGGTELSDRVKAAVTGPEQLPAEPAPAWSTGANTAARHCRTPRPRSRAHDGAAARTVSGPLRRTSWEVWPPGRSCLLTPRSFAGRCDRLAPTGSNDS